MAELDRTIINDTGFITLPVGTTAQRPSSPELGMMRWNTDEELVEFYNGSEWIAVEGGGGSGIFGIMEDLNSSLTAYSYNNVSSIKSELENAGLTLIATPAYNGMAEDQTGTTNITNIRQFDYTEFDSGQTLENSSGFSNDTLNGYPFMVFAGFGPNGYAGIAMMAYRDFSSAALRDFFDEQNKQLYTFVLNQDGSTVEDTNGNTGTSYSDNQGPNSNGYNSTSRFSGDDGSWGFRIGSSNLDGNGGPYLQDNSANAYGCENRNSGDSSGDQFFWGSQTNTNTTNYAFYFCIKYPS